MDMLTDLRARLDLVGDTSVTDATLQWCLDVSQAVVNEYEPNGPYALVTEATLQGATVVYENRGQGTMPVGPDGEYFPPMPTSGLHATIMRVLRPALPTNVVFC